MVLGKSLSLSVYAKDSSGVTSIGHIQNIVVKLPPDNGCACCGSTKVWIKLRNLVINRFVYRLYNTGQLIWVLLDCLPQLDGEHHSAMFTNCKTTMAVKNSEDSTSRVVGCFINMAIRILHLRPKPLILVFCLSILFHAGAFNNLNSMNTLTWGLHCVSFL